MPDLILHRLSFGGVALEPTTDAGADWLLSITDGVTFDVFMPSYHDGNRWIVGDACMEGFPTAARGFQPGDAPDILGGARSCGLDMEAA